MPTGLTSLFPFKTNHILVPSCTPLLDRPKFQDGYQKHMKYLGVPYMALSWFV
jgi:hypothetical protein